MNLLIKKILWIYIKPVYCLKNFVFEKLKFLDKFKSISAFSALFLILANYSYADESSQKNTKLVYLSEFSPFKSIANSKLSEKIYLSIAGQLESKGFQVKKATGSSIEEKLSLAKNSGAWFLVDGYYKKADGQNLNIFIQTYNPSTGYVIDAIPQFQEYAIFEGVKWDEEEVISYDEQLISSLSRRLVTGLQTNLQRVERRGGIENSILKSPISEIKFNLTKEESGKALAEVFKHIESQEVVSASRKLQNISEAPSKVIVFTREMIHNRGYRSLTELLQDVPGFDFNSFNDSGEYPTDLILRGISDVGQTQILLMENGIIQNDIGNGWLRHVQFDTVLIDIERIEIILGPGSALYGANAYAGLINIITRKGKDIFKDKSSNIAMETKLQAGKNNTYLNEGLFAYKMNNEMIFQLSGRYYNTSGDRGLNRPDPGNYFHNNFEPDKVQTLEYGIINNDKTPFGTRKTLPDGFNNSAKDFFVRGSLSKDGLSIGFNVWDLKEGLGSYVPSYEYFTNTSQIPYTKHHRGYFVNANYETNITKNLYSTTKVYYRNTTIMPETGFEYTYRYQSIDFPIQSNGKQGSPIPDRAKQYYGPSFLTGAQQHFNYAATETNHLVFGFQLDKFSRQSISDTVGGVSLGKMQNTNSNLVTSSWESAKPSTAAVFYSTTGAGYIQDEQKFFDNKLSLTFGIRHDQDSDYGKIWARRAAVIGKPLFWYNVKFLYGEAFKAPTVFQLYDEFRGNKNLRPQKIKTYEIENSFLINKLATIKAGYFISLMDGLIAEGKNPDPNAPSTKSTIFQNFQPNHIYGFTLEGDYMVTNDFKFFGNCSITRQRDIHSKLDVQADSAGKILSISPIYGGSEIDNIAERKANLGVNAVFFKKLNLNLRMNLVGRRKAPLTNKYYQPYDFNFTSKFYPYQIEGKPDGYMSGYALLNATITYKELFNIDGLEIQIICRNLLNNAYSGMGRQSGNAVRPIDSLQPAIRNPEGFVSPYHPQPGREVFFQISYRY